MLISISVFGVVGTSDQSWRVVPDAVQVEELCEAGGVPLDTSSNAALARSLQAAEEASSDPAAASLIKSLCTRAMAEAQYICTGLLTCPFVCLVQCRDVADALYSLCGLVVVCRPRSRYGTAVWLYCCTALRSPSRSTRDRGEALHQPRTGLKKLPDWYKAASRTAHTPVCTAFRSPFMSTRDVAEALHNACIAFGIAYRLHRFQHCITPGLWCFQRSLIWTLSAGLQGMTCRTMGASPISGWPCSTTPTSPPLSGGTLT